MSKFSAEQAFEAQEEGNPIILTVPAAIRICKDHGADYAEYLEFTIENSRINKSEFSVKVDAADLLGWLGY